MNEQAPDPKVVAHAKTVLEDLLRLMTFEAKVEVFSQSEGEASFSIESADAGRLIGRGAQVLDALQFILNRMIARKHETTIHCVVDVERYRERRKDRVLQEAFEAVERVAQEGVPVRLSPMSAADRRIVHQALKDNPSVETHSEPCGDEGRKCVVISPAGMGKSEQSSEDSNQ
jgi:spoIIIJ-associated protein